MKQSTRNQTLEVLCPRVSGVEIDDFYLIIFVILTNTNRMILYIMSNDIAIFLYKKCALKTY